jgi:hypothetical protein
MVGILILVAMIAYAQAVHDDADRLTVMYPHVTQADHVRQVEAVPVPVSTRFGIQFGGIR